MKKQAHQATHRSRIQPFVVAMASLSAVACWTHARAEDYSSTNVQYFYTSRSKEDLVLGTGSSDQRLHAVRLEHYGTFKYGDNYFFIDEYHGNKVGGSGAGSFGGDTKDQQFLVWTPRLSLSRLTGSKWSIGPVQDVYLATRGEFASYGSFRSLGIGLAIDWKAPGFSYLSTRLYRRDNNYNRPQAFFHTVWSSSFALVGPRKAHADGYLWTTRTDTHGRQWYAESDFTVDVDQSATFQAGLRVTYSQYKNGGNNYSRTTPQLLGKWIF
ncbi:outer membrane protein OmpK [Acidovorax sp.]|uniref:outer membrane protein OmpK n=1 Tax=Acidovorax sp. TaxID=1872122 RepID=UPI002620528F|nr:outer membrane protein OmpK [Acidovorax sp.]